MKASFFSFVITLFIGLQTVHAQTSQNGQLRMNPNEIKALKAKGTTAPGSSNYSAVQEIVLLGDPSKPGLYTIILKVAGNTKIAAHYHPDQRIATVLSGNWYFGYGDHFDEKQLKLLPAGSVYSEVKGQNHFAMTKEPVVVEITGYGPSGVTYFDPADNPKKK
jgi:hypothetical protein